MTEESVRRILRGLLTLAKQIEEPADVEYSVIMEHGGGELFEEIEDFMVQLSDRLTGPEDMMKLYALLLRLIAKALEMSKKADVTDDA